MREKTIGIIAETCAEKQHSRILTEFKHYGTLQVLESTIFQYTTVKHTSVHNCGEPRNVYNMRKIKINVFYYFC